VTPRELLDGLRDANFHAGGIRCLRLLRLDARYFGELGAEVAVLCDRERPSDVRAREHVTNWTRPRGAVLQFSLLNLSGRASDFSEDHNLSSFRKQFHLGVEYPSLARFVDAFPDIVNFRVNVLGPGARLSAHEEHSIIRMQSGSIGACVRYHLPLVTNQSAELTLDGYVFHLEAGIVHLVNHGCVHAARNGGSERRVHLVWDQLLTRRAYDAVFGGDNAPAWATRTHDGERTPSPLRIERMGAYMRLPTPVDRDAAEKLDLCATQ
jgi:Aspartyl/Asparaginyl beta-hydroxylase